MSPVSDTGMPESKAVAAAWLELMEAADQFTRAFAPYCQVCDNRIVGPGQDGPHGYAGYALIGMLDSIITALKDFMEGRNSPEQDQDVQAKNN